MRPLHIFVSYASGCLTDHEPHGDGLICFSILDGLARRGHKVFAYTPYAAIRNCHPGLQVHVEGHRSPADSLAGWEHLWRARKWLKTLVRENRIDVTWRMHPYGEGCPATPPTMGRPLVIGPLFRGWPLDTPTPAGMGKPRFGIGIAKYLRPLAARGWERAMKAAGLLLCATPGHVQEMQQTQPQAKVLLTPVMVDLPSSVGTEHAFWTGRGPLRLLFVANLVPSKHPNIFCETIGELRRRGIDAKGTIVGDGEQRTSLEKMLNERLLADHVRLLGKIPNAEVFSHMMAAHFLVSTSVGEPYGRGIAEAMAVGTPVACHRSGGPEEFVADGKDGMLVRNLSAAAYADAIARIVSDPENWHRLAREAAQTAKAWRSEIVLGNLESALTGLRPSAESQ